MALVRKSCLVSSLPILLILFLLKKYMWSEITAGSSSRTAIKMHEIAVESVDGFASVSEARQEFFDNVLYHPIQSRRSLMCHIKRMKPKFVSASSAFLMTWELWKRRVPKNVPFDGKVFESCAAVSSSGGMLHSNLGKEIDSHELIMRFNDATVESYEAHVGFNPGNVRVVNGQLPLRWGKRKHDLLHTFIEANSTILFWHHCCCGIVKFSDCLELEPETGLVRKIKMDEDESPDGIRTYFALLQQYPSVPNFYLVDIEFIYLLWEFLQKAYGRQLAQERPPSSGFIGLMILLHMCKKVHAYEFIPSRTRNTGLMNKCHYYDPPASLLSSRDANKTCDIYGSGRWHPMTAEKAILYQLNTAPDEQVFNTGVLTLEGAAGAQCVEE